MTDRVATLASATPIPSPCIGICKINQQTGWCEGCWRTLDEIALWGTSSESEKHAVWQKIHQRHDELSLFDPAHPSPPKANPC